MADGYTKIVLTIIAAWVVIVARDFGMVKTADAQAGITRVSIENVSSRAFSGIKPIPVECEIGLRTNFSLI